MKTLGIFVFAALLLLPAAVQPASALENEDNAPTAFVEGTAGYTIPYLERTLAKLQRHFSENELKELKLGIADLKAQNMRLTERTARLRANKTFLKENDTDMVRYRETLARTTDTMFGLLRKLNERSALPPR